MRGFHHRRRGQRALVLGARLLHVTAGAAQSEAPRCSLATRRGSLASEPGALASAVGPATVLTLGGAVRIMAARAMGLARHGVNTYGEVLLS